MKLICVDNRINKSDLVDFDNYKKYYYNLTIYKSYEADRIVNNGNKELVKLNDDLGHVRYFPKDCFKTLDEIRDEKINIILYGK